MNKSEQNYINHIALVVDSSFSMRWLTDKVVQVADELVCHLATQSEKLNQETRVTFYTFNDHTNCVFFDKDVLRFPSIKSKYNASGNTALIDATVLSINDLRMTPQKYGDHAFLTYVLTDGQENASRNHTSREMAQILASMTEKGNETVAVLVPDQKGVEYAKRWGFQPDNIAIWEASVEGLTDVGKVIRDSADTFMTGRESGIRSYSGLFSTDLKNVNKATVNSKTLKAMHRGTYVLLDVKKQFPIREYVQEQGHDFVKGKAYYQLTKTELIQANKQVAIQNIHSGKVYTGQQARDVLQLPSGIDVRVKPATNPEYRIYIQSTSVNRILVPNTKLLILK